jgi:uncharacterized lipoprotein YmbA
MDGDRNDSVVNGRKHSVTPATVISLLLIGAVAALNLWGCGVSQKTNFYMLDSLGRLSPPPPVTENLNIDLGIGPVKIPEYLNRAQIVRRNGQYEIDIAEFDRWAETLESSIPRVLAENLSVLLRTENVYTYPWVGSPPEYRVRIDIVQFDSDSTGNVELTVRWALLRGRNDRQIAWKRFSDKKPIAGQGYPGMVSAMSLTLYDLSREIAQYVSTEAAHGSVRTD